MIAMIEIVSELLSWPTIQAFLFAAALLVIGIFVGNRAEREMDEERQQNAHPPLERKPNSTFSTETTETIGNEA